MKDIVIVFARAPRLGAVKRRLAREIGQRAALRFHVQTLTRLLRALLRERRFRTLLAVTPDRLGFRLSVGVPRIPQGTGDLERRMERAFRRFPHARVALVGSDIPELGPTDLHAAFRALGRADAVFGPAEDGGYWLVGDVAPAPGHTRSRACAGLPRTRLPIRCATSRGGGSRCCVHCVTWTPARISCEPLLSRRFQMLLQPRHQLHQIAWSMPHIELPEQNIVPAVLDSARAAGKREQIGSARHAADRA